MKANVIRVACGGLFIHLPGCVVQPMTARDLAGYSNPSFHMKTPKGWTVEAGTEAAGKAHFEQLADGSVRFDLEMSSDPSPVVAAEGARAEFLNELRRMDNERTIAQQQMMNTMWGYMFNLIAQLAPQLFPKPTPQPQPLPDPVPVVPAPLGPFFPSP